MSQPEKRTGVSRDEIQTVLIDPVNALGIPKSKSVTATDHRRGLEMLCARLRYLNADDLSRLADEVELMARQFKCWPTVYLILDRAEGIRPDPLRRAKIDESVRSMMRSVPGQAALAGDDDCPDWAVEMLKAVLKKGHGWKVTTFETDRWKRAALDVRHHEKRIAAAAIADAHAAEEEALQAQADGDKSAAILRTEADRSTARAAPHRARLQFWTDFEARAAEMVRSQPPSAHNHKTREGAS